MHFRDLKAVVLGEKHGCVKGFIIGVKLWEERVSYQVDWLIYESVWNLYENREQVRFKHLKEIITNGYKSV